MKPKYVLINSTGDCLGEYPIDRWSKVVADAQFHAAVHPNKSYYVQRVETLLVLERASKDPALTVDPRSHGECNFNE